MIHFSARRAVCRFMHATLLGALSAATIGSAQAQAFPSHSVQINVGLQAGGAADNIARTLAEGLSQIWGQPVIVANKPGAGGALAVQETIKAKADGYTLVLANEGSITRSQFLTAKLGYDSLKDLVPIAAAGVVPMVLVVNPEVMKAGDLKTFLAQAKAAPGKIDYASSGTGASHHISMAMLERAASIKLNQIAYKGGAPALTDVLGGHVPTMFVAVSTALPFIKSSKLVALGVSGAQRSAHLPNIPTIAEQGFPGYETGDWLSIFTPRDTSPEVVRKIIADMATVTRSPAYQQKLLSAGLETKPSAGKDLAELIARTIEANREIFRAAGIVPE